MTLPICASCRDVTLISWPMGTEPMVVGCQRFKGRNDAGGFGRQLNSGTMAEAKALDVFVQILIAYLHANPDSADVT